MPRPHLFRIGLLAMGEVVGDGEAGDFAGFTFEVTGIGGERPERVKLLRVFMIFDY